MPGVRSGDRVRVATDVLLDPARRGLGGPGGGTPTPPKEAQTYRISLPNRLLQLQ